MQHSTTSKVYMVELGENYEGVYRSALHFTLSGAISTAHKWIGESCFDWKQVTPTDSDIHAWGGGCDYIRITEKEIGE